MATIDFTITEFPKYPHVVMLTWETLTNGDQGRPFEFLEHADRTVQFTGTFDTSTVVLQGSNDGTNWGTMDDFVGDAISLAAANLVPRLVSGIPRYMRPACTAGGGSTDIDCTLTIRRQRP